MTSDRFAERATAVARRIAGLLAWEEGRRDGRRLPVSVGDRCRRAGKELARARQAESRARSARSEERRRGQMELAESCLARAERECELADELVATSTT